MILFGEDFPGVSTYADRHGRPRWRYRSKGRTVQLPAPDEDEAAFREHYEAAVEGREPKKAEVVAMPGAALPETFAAAFRMLKVTAKWISYDDATKKKNTDLIEEFLVRRIVDDHPLTWAQVPVKSMRLAHVEELLGAYATTPHKAKHLLTAIRKLIRVAARDGWIDVDPTHLVEWRPAYKGWKAWPAEVMAKFEARWAPGTAARTCYALALWLGNRRGNVAGLRWDQRCTKRIVIEGEERSIDGFDIVPKKNARRNGEKRLFLPITPMLEEALDAAPRVTDTILATAYGNPFSEKSLTGMMAHWTKLAGIESGYTLHGLRKSLGVYLAEAEASTRQLMEVLGHDDIDHAELYSREASQIRLAVTGMERVVRLVGRAAKK
jgi:hypothetical protein